MHKLPETLWALFELAVAHPVLAAASSLLAAVGFALWLTGQEKGGGGRRRVGLSMLLLSLMSTLAALLLARSRVR